MRIYTSEYLNSVHHLAYTYSQCTETLRLRRMHDPADEVVEITPKTSTAEERERDGVMAVMMIISWQR